MNKLALTLKYLLVYLAVSSFLALAGCNTYVAGMRWHHLDVIVAAPPPQPYPYPYEYYYSPVYLTALLNPVPVWLWMIPITTSRRVLAWRPTRRER